MLCTGQFNRLALEPPPAIGSPRGADSHRTGAIVEDEQDGLVVSPLHEREVAAGARFAAFGGWSMPLEFAGAGVLAEHLAVRQAVGVFDVSHLGKASITGRRGSRVRQPVPDRRPRQDRPRPGAVHPALQHRRRRRRRPDRLPRGRRTRSSSIPTPPTAQRSSRCWRRRRRRGSRSRNEHRDHAVLAVQGPLSDEVLTAAGLPAGHGYMSFVDVDRDGSRVTVCRTGYTGERGYELVVPAAGAVAVWDAVVAAGEPYGLQPAGLAARDTLRTEMGYPLHGQDICPTITPVQARLGWAVGWSEGRRSSVTTALRAEKQAGPSRLLLGTARDGPRDPAAGHGRPGRRRRRGRRGDLAARSRRRSRPASRSPCSTSASGRRTMS